MNHRPEGNRAIEHLVLALEQPGFGSDGIMVRVLRAGPIRRRYRLTGDPEWRVTRLEAEVAEPVQRRIAITADGGHRWYTRRGRAADRCGRHRRRGHRPRCFDQRGWARPWTGRRPADGGRCGPRAGGTIPRAGVRRLLVVGGAGSLEVDSGVQLVDTPGVPAAWRPVALAHRVARAVYLDAELDWRYVSPAAFIDPGTRTGTYRTGTERLLTDEKGECRISAEDLAVAVLEELEHTRFSRQRFTVAY